MLFVERQKKKVYINITYELCDYEIFEHASQEHNHKHRVSKTKSRTLMLGVVRPGCPIKFQGWACILYNNVVSWILLKELTKKTCSCSLTPQILLRQGRE